MVEKVLQLNREKTIFWTLAGVLFLSFVFYVYMINVTVHNVVARQNLEAEANSLTLAIGSKEFEYISKRNNVNLAMAYGMGFEDTNVKAYISTSDTNSVAYLSH